MCLEVCLDFQNCLISILRRRADELFAASGANRRDRRSRPHDVKAEIAVFVFHRLESLKLGRLARVMCVTHSHYGDGWGAWGQNLERAFATERTRRAECAKWIRLVLRHDRRLQWCSWHRSRRTS